MALRQLQIQPVILKKGKSENFIILYDSCFIYFSSTNIKSLTDTGEGSKLVYRRKRPKVDTLFSTLFFRTRPSGEYDSARSRTYSRPLLDVFPCIGWIYFKILFWRHNVPYHLWKIHIKPCFLPQMFRESTLIREFRHFFQLLRCFLAGWGIILSEKGLVKWRVTFNSPKRPPRNNPIPNTTQQTNPLTTPHHKN